MKKDAAPKKQNQNDPSAYYQLHTGAIDDLVGANKENTPQYSKAELEKYRGRRFKWRLPDPLKALLIKYWFYGAICFFVFMGLGMYIADSLDMFFIASLICGMVTDRLINHFLRFTEKMPGGSRKWMMVSRRGTAGFIMNVMYGFVILFLVMTGYSLLNGLIASAGGETILRVEPLLFGLMATLADMLCIGMKRMFLKIIADARKSIK